MAANIVSVVDWWAIVSFLAATIQEIFKYYVKYYVKGYGGRITMGWIVRALLFVSGVIASWFVSVEASNYIVYQLVIAVGLVTLCAAALVYLPAWWRRWTSGSGHRK